MHLPYRVALAAGLVLTLLLGAAPVAAAGPTPPPSDQTSGKVGAYGLQDTSAHPAGTCTYQSGPSNYLEEVGSKAPRVFATAGRSSQRVGLRLVVEWYKNASWRTFASTSWRYRTATPAHAAGFAAVHRSFVADQLDTVSDYRARLDLRWYARDGTTVTGRASLWVDHYWSVDPPNAPFLYDIPRCAETTG